MRYIDKHKRHNEAHALNVKHLKSLYSRNLTNPDPSPAEGDRSFASFKRFKKNWKPILVEEQTVEGACRCCYCMRKIDETKGESGIEHVIPRSLSGDKGKEQYNYYASHASALSNYVVMADEFAEKTFVTKEDFEKETRMPHTTALSNLVITCNGKGFFPFGGCCCNNRRGDEKIMPIMLMPNADSDVLYDQNGIITISCNDGTLNKIEDMLNDDTLQEIRSVWYYLSRINKDITNAISMTIDERKEWFEKAYSTNDFDSLPIEVTRYSSVNGSDRDDTYWRLLLAYDWFYYKYRQP